MRDNPWPALAIAVGAGVLLSRSQTDVKAAAATVAATRGASSKVGTVLDDVVANLVGGLHEAFESRITSMVNDLKSAIGRPFLVPGTAARARPIRRRSIDCLPVVTDRIDGMGRPVDPLGSMQPHEPTDSFVMDQGARWPTQAGVGPSSS